MILTEGVNKVIRDLINAVLGVSGFAIRAQQSSDAPRPNGAYASVNYLNTVRVGTEQRTYANNQLDPDITESIEGYRELTFSVSFYRDDSIDNAEFVRTALARQNIQATLKQAKLGYVSSSECRNVSEALSSVFEQRTQFDLTLSAIGSDADILTAIETLTIGGEFQSGSTSHNFDIEVQ